MLLDLIPQWIRLNCRLKFVGFLLTAVSVCYFSAPSAMAQEPPYFVTYSDALEEPGNLEIAMKGVQAAP
ncbi:MAG: hypothetical protein WBG02_18490, partial [Candidatus Acidiferrum sp.]